MIKLVLEKVESVDKLVKHINNGGNVIFSDGKKFDRQFILSSKLSELLKMISDEKIYAEISA